MAEDAFNIHILPTKLNRPNVDSNWVLRPRLISRLDKGLKKRLTLISAPAGYGKSMLVSYWLETCCIPGAWISLDENDNDLRAFTAYFIAAAESLLPGACRETGIVAADAYSHCTEVLLCRGGL